MTQEERAGKMKEKRKETGVGTYLLLRGNNMAAISAWGPREASYSQSVYVRSSTNKVSFIRREM
jgi:hypothetical protein